MKKGTLIIWVIIFGCLAMLMIQNQAYFMAKQSLRINPVIFQQYQSPQLPNAVIALCFFFAGLLIAYLFSLPARLRANRTIKKLNATISSQSNQLTDLRRELNTLKGVESTTEDRADTVKIDMAATQKIGADLPQEAGEDADKTIKFSAAETDAESGDPEAEEKPDKQN